MKEHSAEVFQTEAELLDEQYHFFTVFGDETKKIKILKHKFLNVLSNMGIHRIDIDNNAFLVQIKDNIAESLEIRQIEDKFFRFVFGHDQIHNEVENEKIMESVLNSQDRLFNKKLLNRLYYDNAPPFHADTQTAGYFYYQNGFVEVTEENIRIQPYDKIKNLIWRNQILPRTFKKLDPEEFENGHAAKFVRRLAGHFPKEDQSKEDKKKGGENKDHIPRPGRYHSLKSIIGYNLHRFYEQKLKATIFTDSVVSEENDGRSGKTLLARFIGNMLNTDKHAKTYVEISGKTFDHTKQTRYEKCDITTKIIHLNDVRKYFPFWTCYNDITDGADIRRMYEAPFTIMVKIIITANSTIKMGGDSDKDRAIEYQIYSYYSARFSPEQEFNAWFFRDWDEAELNRYDNFMIHCLQFYLQHGIIEVDHINLEERKLLEETSAEFIEWMGDPGNKHYSLNEEFDKTELYQEFIKPFPEVARGRHGLTTKTFSRWLRKYALYTPGIEDLKERQSNGRYLAKFLSAEGKRVDEVNEAEKDDLPF